ncbi:hypothetical protein MHN79_05265 [Vibrio sp. Of14-4]|uniref:hypothetical protein n=1 Tax=Vibrio sp. Of14-4 TaxID=2724878 RepID=UPI001EF317F8|nr:hypothetical protein [Vibrio sp. Of14-4]MCG7488890.1 hypothetical protein [Vibrio sp. Of14-4]
MELTKWFIVNKELLAFFVTFIGAAWAAYKYFDLKNREERRHDYKAYHELISAFTDGATLEKQMVILYELRNYRRYFEITKELLEHLLIRMERENADSQLIKLTKSTLVFINKH